MRTVRISDAVYKVIASKGKFGETVDDVLRREFGVVDHPKARSVGTSSRRRTFATNRMSSNISQNRLIVKFASGERKEWVLPDKSDKNGIRIVRNAAGAFAIDCGATEGQVNAVYKTLTEGGYHLTK